MPPEWWLQRLQEGIHRLQDEIQRVKEEVPEHVDIKEGLLVWQHVSGSFILEFTELQDDGSTCSHSIWLTPAEASRLANIIQAHAT